MITVQDLRKVGDVAQDCDLRKVNEAIEQALEFDLSELLCGLFFDVEKYLRTDEEAPEDIANLINRTYFDACNGRMYHVGLRHVVSLFAYSRYLRINQYHDSHSGMTVKRADWADIIGKNDLKNYANPYFQQAKQAFKNVELYICRNKEKYKRYNFSNCVACSCGKCSDNSNTRSGFSASVINIKRPRF